MKNLNEAIRKYCLKNAVDYNGKCSPKAVIPKIIYEFPEEKRNIKKIIEKVERTCDRINSMSIKEQKKELEFLAPEILVEKKVKEKYKLPDLTNAVNGRVITAFPPNPSKHLHIGHAKTIVINYELAKKYDGKFILRIEDSNPKEVKKEYYESIINDVKWLAPPDEIIYISDNFDYYHGLMKKLILEKNAYVCTCDKETISENRWNKRECNCRRNSIKKNMELWEKMFSHFKEGDAVLRLKGDMGSKNTVMRDPTIARIINKKHPRTRKNHKVYPTYDFPTAVEDAKITHRYRSKEFELRKELQELIRYYLNLKQPKIYEIARFNINGSTTKGREIRELIKNKIVNGWDDPRLVTLKALRKRGILPEAIKEFVIESGISKTEGEIDLNVLLNTNRKIIDKKANRYFFVPNPIKLFISKLKPQKIMAKLHPEKNEKRILNINDEVLISKNDLKYLKEGEEVRLKDAFNVRILNIMDDAINSTLSENQTLEHSKKLQKIQWVPSNSNIKIRVIEPHLLFVNGKLNKNSLKIVEGVGEININSVKINEIVQFERYGFCKKENKNTFIKCC